MGLTVSLVSAPPECFLRARTRDEFFNFGKVLGNSEVSDSTDDAIFVSRCRKQWDSDNDKVSDAYCLSSSLMKIITVGSAPLKVFRGLSKFSETASVDVVTSSEVGFLQYSGGLYRFSGGEKQWQSNNKANSILEPAYALVHSDIWLADELRWLVRDMREEIFELLETNASSSEIEQLGNYLSMQEKRLSSIVQNLKKFPQLTRVSSAAELVSFAITQKF